MAQKGKSPDVPLETFSKVVEAIYDCALDPTRWQNTIRLTAELCRSQACQTIVLMRERKPDIYIRVVAGLLPKEANINVEANEAFVELWRRISDGLGDELADRLDEEPLVVKH